MIQASSAIDSTNFEFLIEEGRILVTNRGISLILALAQSSYLGSSYLCGNYNHYRFRMLASFPTEQFESVF